MLRKYKGQELPLCAKGWVYDHAHKPIANTFLATPIYPLSLPFLSVLLTYRKIALLHNGAQPLLTHRRQTFLWPDTATHIPLYNMTTLFTTILHLKPSVSSNFENERDILFTELSHKRLP